MTGEITLHGRVMPIGGLREKTMAAFKEGMKTVIIPKGNEGDMDEIDETVKEGLNFVLAETLEDVLKTALTGGRKMKNHKREKSLSVDVNGAVTVPAPESTESDSEAITS